MVLERSSTSLSTTAAATTTTQVDYIKVCYPSEYEEVKRVCASCKLQRICAQDLVRGDVKSGMRIYCANAPIIDAIVVNWLV